MDKSRCLLDERKPDESSRVIAFLEENGYRKKEDESRGRQEIIDSFLPLYADKSEKAYWMMGNVTNAAAARSSGQLAGKDVFYKWLKE
ncbi:MAG: hypothetical protein K6E75_03650 [Lachnospiraceae bacterium]|nr:hypothetical protein [Lachnospiraceae bacterium]